jgi:hypothetical protein
MLGVVTPLAKRMRSIDSSLPQEENRERVTFTKRTSVEGGGHRDLEQQQALRVPATTGPPGSHL